MERIFLKPSEVAELTGLAAYTVRRMCHQGRLRSVRVSDRGDVLIPRAELDRWLAEAGAVESATDEVAP